MSTLDVFTHLSRVGHQPVHRWLPGILAQMKFQPFLPCLSCRPLGATSAEHAAHACVQPQQVSQLAAARPIWRLGLSLRMQHCPCPPTDPLATSWMCLVLRSVSSARLIAAESGFISNHSGAGAKGVGLRHTLLGACASRCGHCVAQHHTNFTHKQGQTVPSSSSPPPHDHSSFLLCGVLCSAHTATPEPCSGWLPLGGGTTRWRCLLALPAQMCVWPVELDADETGVRAA